MGALRLLIAAAFLSGCGWYDGTLDPISLPTSFTDPVCRDVARIRSSDAAVNGFEGVIQVRIARDSYAACVQNKAR